MGSIAFLMHEVPEVFLPVLALLLSTFVALGIIGSLSEPHFLQL